MTVSTAIRPRAEIAEDIPSDAVGDLNGHEPVRAVAQPREEVILSYLPLVKHIAGRIRLTLPSAVEKEDLVQYGTLGLIDAVDRFDPSLGVKLTTFAVPRIRGAILDSLRSIDPVPRSIRHGARVADRASEVLTAELGRPPTATEIAGRLQIDIAKYRAMRSVVSRQCVSLDTQLSGDEGDESSASGAEHIADDSPAVEADLEAAELKQALGEAVDRLPLREQAIIELRFRKGLTFREIAPRLHISESRVIQVLRGTLDTLRNSLEEPVTGELPRPVQRPNRDWHGSLRAVPLGNRAPGDMDPAHRLTPTAHAQRRSSPAGRTTFQGRPDEATGQVSFGRDIHAQPFRPGGAGALGRDQVA